jgi:hypothetical protein
MFSGTSTIFSMFCSAVMGSPQAMAPISGIFFIFGIGSKPGGMVGSLDAAGAGCTSSTMTLFVMPK